MATKVQHIPSPRSWSFCSSSQDILYLWGGDGDTEAVAAQLFDVKSETWMKKITKGPHPPAGLFQGGCALAGRHLFLYGGQCGSSCSGTLYQINIDDWTWRELSNCAAGGPGEKRGCGLIVYKDQLLLLGGCYFMEPESRQPGARYEFGYTNELHCYSLTTGSWSSLSVKGSRPPPCSDFSLTMIDKEHAVMFGGYIPNSGWSADVHVLHLPTMSWTYQPHKDGDPRPSGRSSHIAMCLGYGGQHKRVLISGGCDVSITMFGDTWLLDPQSGRWEEIQVPNGKIIQRYAHSAASFNLSLKYEEVILFGGIPTLWGHSIADTVAMRFELQGSSSSSTKSWILTNIADQTQLGSSKRLDEKRRIIESSSTQNNEGADESTRSLQQQLEAMEIRVQESDRRAEESDRRAEESDRRAEESDRMAEESDRRAEESDRRAEESDRRAEESDRRAEESDRRTEQVQQNLIRVTQSLQEKAREVEVAREQQAHHLQRLQDSEQHLQERVMEAQLARQQLRDLERNLQERTREVQLLDQQLRECEQRLAASNSHWVVRRDEIDTTGPELGRGGWATVSVATFRGARVAAKTIHHQIISHHNIDLFRREMTMAARLRHPNLVQFIGATTEGNMVILTELMPTSLRARLQLDTYLQPPFVKSISLDVAKALNYLHQMQPHPIIHRDLSSANVLMEPLPGGQWRAKLSDYGTVNLVCQLETINPGSPVYAAPEANNPHFQSPKMDIYSFGALMLEMLTGKFPTPEDRPSLLRKVHHEQFLALIQRCLSERKQDRPDAAAVIRELN